MPAPYNISANVSDITEITTQLNTATNGIFSVTILVMIGLVIFLSMKDQPVSSSLSTTVFLLFIIGAFMFAMNLLNIYIMGILIALLAITAIVLFFTR